MKSPSIKKMWSTYQQASCRMSKSILADDLCCAFLSEIWSMFNSATHDERVAMQGQLENKGIHIITNEHPLEDLIFSYEDDHVMAHSCSNDQVIFQSEASFEQTANKIITFLKLK